MLAVLGVLLPAWNPPLTSGQHEKVRLPLTQSSQPSPSQSQDPPKSQDAPKSQESLEQLWRTAQARGVIYEDCGRNACRLLQGWIDQKRDPATHLYSRGQQWNYHNEAADHYSSLVLMAFYLKPELLQEGGTLQQTLMSCHRLCRTPSGLLANYNLKTKSRERVASLAHLSEWLRDGLLRIVEVLGTENQWYQELERLTDAMLAEAERRGGLSAAFTAPEPVGNMLQTLTRLYAFSGKQRYLLAAEELADVALAHPEKTLGTVSFRDHGCELVPGLSELFALEAQLGRAKAKEYHQPLQLVLDRILESSAHPVSGLFANWSPTVGGQRRWSRPPDTWGYVLFAFQNYDSATGEKRYRAAVEKPLRWLTDQRENFARQRRLWPQADSSDSWSDSYESMLVLSRRYPLIPETELWLDWATCQHIHRKQSDRPYGPYTGGHFDGSTGRTLCLHMMLNSQGVRAIPFDEGVQLGAVQQNNVLYLSLESETGWEGKLYFDHPRNEHQAAKIHWARINEMPQWFVVNPQQHYQLLQTHQLQDSQLQDSQLQDSQGSRTVEGKSLIAGLDVVVQPKKPLRLQIILLP